MNDSLTTSSIEKVLLKLTDIEKLCLELKKSLGIVDEKQNQVLVRIEPMASLAVLQTQSNDHLSDIKTIIKDQGDASLKAAAVLQAQVVDAYKASAGLMSPRILMYICGFGLSLLAAVGVYNANKTEQASKETATAIAQTFREEFRESRQAAEVRNNKLIDVTKGEKDTDSIKRR